MAGPQVQHSHSHSQRPNSAYYMGLNGGGGGGIATNGHHAVGGGTEHTHTTTATSISTSSSAHTGLYALRQMSNDMELIYRGNSANASHQRHSAMLTHGVIQQQPTGAAVGTSAALDNSGSAADVVSGSQIVSIAGPGPSATDALIVPSNSAMTKRSNLASSKSKQRSVEIVVDASQCGTAGDDDVDGGKSGDDVEQGHRMSRHRRRPLHRRLFSYLRSLFQGSAAQHVCITASHAGCIGKMDYPLEEGRLVGVPLHLGHTEPIKGYISTENQAILRDDPLVRIPSHYKREQIQESY